MTLLMTNILRNWSYLTSSTFDTSNLRCLTIIGQFFCNWAMKDWFFRSLAIQFVQSKIGARCCCTIQISCCTIWEGYYCCRKIEHSAYNMGIVQVKTVVTDASPLTIDPKYFNISFYFWASATTQSDRNWNELIFFIIYYDLFSCPTNCSNYVK